MSVMLEAPRQSNGSSIYVSFWFFLNSTKNLFNYRMTIKTKNFPYRFSPVLEASLHYIQTINPFPGYYKLSHYVVQKILFNSYYLTISENLSPLDVCLPQITFSISLPKILLFTSSDLHYSRTTCTRF